MFSVLASGSQLFTQFGLLHQRLPTAVLDSLKTNNSSFRVGANSLIQALIIVLKLALLQHFLLIELKIKVYHEGTEI